MKLCYIEDCIGATICYEYEKEYFLSLDECATICFEGTREELEEYLGHKIIEKYISRKREI
jgi:hypothetical protein